MLLADFNSLKLKALEGQDPALYNVHAGSSYFSNFVSVALDRENNVVYFSDVHRWGIVRSDILSAANTVKFEIFSNFPNGFY